tara:strand:- start:8906 stop:11110 length:2205 start_codon:yes stop_codon:yes gene_type:complete
MYSRSEDCNCRSNDFSKDVANVYISWGSLDIFGDYSGCQPTPMVSIEYNNQFIGSGREHSYSTIKLSGQIVFTKCLEWYVNTGAATPDGKTLNNRMEALLWSMFRIGGGEGFSKNFQKLTITENSLSSGLGDVKSWDTCQVDGISFSESTLADVVEYNISIKCYEYAQWHIHNVVDPVDSLSFKDNEDGTWTMTHSVSARGVESATSHTNHSPNHANAFENAFNFVKSRVRAGDSTADLNPASQNAFINASIYGGNGSCSFTPNSLASSTWPNIYPVLVSSSEKMNRLEGTYSVEEVYSFNLEKLDGTPRNSFAPVEKASVDISDDADGHALVNLTFELDGGRDWELGSSNGNNGLFGYLNTINLVQLARNISGIGLAAGAVSFSVDTEGNSVSSDDDVVSVTAEGGCTGKQIGHNKIIIKASWSTNRLYLEHCAGGTGSDATGCHAHGAGDGRAYFDHNISFDYDTITGLTTATISGTIKSKGNVLVRNQNVNNFLEKINMGVIENVTPPHSLSAYLLNLIDDMHVYSNGLAGIKPLNFPMHHIPLSLNVDSNPAVGEISISATFDDREEYVSRGAIPSANFKDVNLALEWTAALPIYKPNPSFNQNGYYLIYDLQARSREKFSIQLGASYDPQWLDGSAVGWSGTDQGPDHGDSVKMMLNAMQVEMADGLMTDLGNHFLGFNDGIDLRPLIESESKDSDLRLRSFNHNITYNLNLYAIQIPAGNNSTHYIVQ